MMLGFIVGIVFFFAVRTLAGKDLTTGDVLLGSLLLYVTALAFPPFSYYGWQTGHWCRRAMTAVIFGIPSALLASGIGWAILAMRGQGFHWNSALQPVCTGMTFSAWFGFILDKRMAEVLKGPGDAPSRSILSSAMIMTCIIGACGIGFGALGLLISCSIAMVWIMNSLQGIVRRFQ